MTDDKLGTGFIAKGQEFAYVNRPTDVDTIFCDGMKGASAQPHVTKVSFFQQVFDPLDPSTIKAKYVFNLAIPNDQFIEIANLLKAIADDLTSKQNPKLVDENDAGGDQK